MAIEPAQLWTFRSDPAFSSTAVERSVRAPFAAPSRGAPPLSDDFHSQVAAIATRVRCHASDLYAVMWFESRLNPAIRNPMSHAVGLIQFLPSTAADLLGLPKSMPGRGGLAAAAFERMSPEEQLEQVEAYLEKASNGRSIETLRDLYMCVFYPAAVGKGDGFVIARADDASAFGRLVYALNAGLDATRDGVLTAGEAASVVAGAARAPERVAMIEGRGRRVSRGRRAAVGARRRALDDRRSRPPLTRAARGRGGVASSSTSCERHNPSRLRFELRSSSTSSTCMGRVGPR